MNILHVSDTHGFLATLTSLDSADVVVHSGDFLPNRTFGIRSIEEAFQSKWIVDNAKVLHEWLQCKPLLLTHGNHDYIDVSRALRAIGIDAVSLDDRRVAFADKAFYGFPHVPWFTGNWNYECSPRELEARTEALDLEGVDVLVAHAPIYGVLDRNGAGDRCGSRPMRKLLQESSSVPQWYLHGHIHETAGMLSWNRGINVSNAALTQRLIAL